MNDSPHISVMLAEVLEALAPGGSETYVDGTLGAAGYTKAILAAAPDGRVIGIDRDPWALENAKELNGRLTLIHGNFGDMDVLLAENGIEGVDGVVLDIGVSSVQLDQAERGFSFRADAPLDMRMNPGENTPTAADIVNTYKEADLANLIYRYGEERHSRRVAAAIVRERQEEPVRTTGRLAAIVRRVVPKSPKDPTDQATRTFQALRIAVNNELEELEKGLAAAERVLNPGGRLVVVSFHSLEDGIVKNFLRLRSGNKPEGSRHLPVLPDGASSPTFILPFRKPLSPSEKEVSQNPRARSARLRAAIRTDAQAWKEAA